MRAVVLTTETLHHAHFVREVGRVCNVECAVVERRAAPPPFDTVHSFEHDRDDHERRAWFDGREISVGEFATTIEVGNANEPRVLSHLAKIAPDLIFVFGARKLGPELIGAFPDRLLNLHGGDPEEYRGLDSHLWAIYHRERSGLVTTLHHVDAGLDTGDIVLQTGLHVYPGTPLLELRRINTEACVALATAAISMKTSPGQLPSRPQRRRGRYYSYMPSALKAVCVERFVRLMDAAR